MGKAAVSQELREKYFNECDPDEPLTPDNHRNVDIDREKTEARGTSCVEDLALRIEMGKTNPQFAMFTGLPGSGKSTELLRLAARLERPKGAHLLPVIIDAKEVIDLYSPIDVHDILMAVLYRTEATLLEKEGKDAKDAAKDSRAARFWHWLNTTEVGVKSLEAGAGADMVLSEKQKASLGAKLVLDFKTNPSLREQVRNRLNQNMPAFVEQIRDAMTEANERARKLGYAGLVVIVDSLEKLRGGSTNWEAVLKSAEDLFTGNAPYLHLPVHVIYTIPTALTFRMSIDAAFLPMIKLSDRQGKRWPDGFEMARRLVRKRVPDEHLREFLGATSCEARVEEIIRWSGGYPREIVRLLQTMVMQPTIDEKRFKRLLGMAGDTYRRTVPLGAYAWLAQVHVDKILPIQDDANRATADLMLQNNVVLRYHNDAEWFDVHPAVLGVEGVGLAVEALREERATRKPGRPASQGT